MTYDAGHPCCAEYGRLQKRIDDLTLALENARRDLNGLRPKSRSPKRRLFDDAISRIESAVKR